MFLIRSLHRSVFCLKTGLGVLVVAALFSEPSVFAFQSFEEFSRSKNKETILEVTPSTEPVRAKPGEVFGLHLWVRLAKGWHIYSLESQDKDETLATQIRFDENVFQAKGRWMEPEPAITLDEALDKVVRIHKETVRFNRTLRVPGHLKSGTYSISGSIEFRACDNRICSLPREVGFQTQIQVLDTDRGE